MKITRQVVALVSLFLVFSLFATSGMASKCPDRYPWYCGSGICVKDNDSCDLTVPSPKCEPWDIFCMAGKMLTVYYPGETVIRDWSMVGVIAYEGQFAYACLENVPEGKVSYCEMKMEWLDIGGTKTFALMPGETFGICYYESSTMIDSCNAQGYETGGRQNGRVQFDVKIVGEKAAPTGPCIANEECGWCGTECVLKDPDLACIMVAPPEGYECICVSGQCTAVEDTVPPPDKPDPTKSGFWNDMFMALIEWLFGWLWK